VVSRQADDHLRAGDEVDDLQIEVGTSDALDGVREE
jgi:hypothetical protein